MMQGDLHKLTPERVGRSALVYLRQSSEHQVTHNRESQRLQYALAEKARGLGFHDVEVIDRDLGLSAAGAVRRPGFERVLSQVALGQVGLVLSREVSRLLRTDKDWCQLVEVCRLFDTLIGDEDGLYDLNNTNDQLLLGVKGTISVVELRTLQLRMRDGLNAKASRGELYMGSQPTGFVLDASKQLIKDPNERVRSAIQQVFSTFATSWSIRKTFMWFRDHHVQLPVRGHRGELHWKVPSHEFVAGVLHHPVYAGAYAYGRAQVETLWKEGRLVKRKRVKSVDDWHVLLRDHHEGYIDWETFQANLQRMSKNVPRKRGYDTEGAVRSGRALLAGLVRCGICGRRLGVRYTGGGSRSPQYACQGDYKAGGKTCQWIGGTVVEKPFEERLLAVLSPHGLQASLLVQDSFDREHTERRGLLEHQLEQSRYEAQRAFEQYDAVDARNRLAAGELERRWNAKLAEQHRLEEDLRELDAQRRPLTEEQRHQIAALGGNFELAWSNPRCPLELRKKIVRTVVEEVILTRDDSAGTVRMVIHWKGGAHTEVTIPWVRTHPQQTSVAALDVVAKMAPYYGDEDIARVLNQDGYRTGQGNAWDASRVSSLRQKHNIAGRQRTLPRPGFITLCAAERLLGVSDRTITKLIASGVIHAEQPVPRAPWMIDAADLDSPRVRAVLEHLKKTGRLPSAGDPANQQGELLH